MDTRDAALARLTEQVLTARAARAPLNICGGGSKAFYGGAPRGQALEMRDLAGISSHEPSELVVTVRAGTPLSELEAVLGEHGQCLAFEPPRLGADSTVGGMVAAGLAGPARASAGCVRDFVLGATLLNGRGEVLTFGGQVMKNVAGYDVSRLLAGSMGVLGVICEVSLKVLPQPTALATLEYEVDQPEALRWFNAHRAQALPLNASTWHQGRLRVRLAGARAALKAAAPRLGGRAIDANEAAAWWRSVRDQSHAFFHLTETELARGQCLWRLAVPATSPALALPGEVMCEWHGAQRWYRTSAPAAEVRAAAAGAGGHATLFRGADKSAGAFAPLSGALMQIHRSLKASFDPEQIFNPGRLYADL